MTDAPHLDAAADGAFSGKLADPADTLTKRGGKGIVVYEGQEYDRLAWTRRCAALGYTLAAGEGAILNAALVEVEKERDALRENWSGLLIEQARLMALRDDALAERDALRKVASVAVTYMIYDMVACNGLKCREPNCQSCYGDDEAESHVLKAREARAALAAALAVQP